MDWIHCNTCFTQPGDVKDKNFFLTSCGHMYCDSCIQPDSTEKCKLCESKYTTIPLTSQMRPEVQEYFSDIDEMVRQLSRILQFQNSHRVRIVEYQRILGQKYKAAKDEIKRLQEITRAYQAAITAFQKKVKELEKEIHLLKQRNFRHSPGSRGYPTSPTAKFVMTPKTQSASQSMNGHPTPPFLQRFPNNSSNTPQSEASQSSWCTPNRITLPRRSPGSVGSSPCSNSTSVQSPELNVGQYVMSRSRNTPTYRTVSHYSSQPNTPKTPSTPGNNSSPESPAQSNGSSPGMPTSANRCRVEYVNRYGVPTTSSPSPIPLSLLTLTSQRSRKPAF